MGLKELIRRLQSDAPLVVENVLRNLLQSNGYSLEASRAVEIHYMTIIFP
jgi:hypothetical protein